MRKLLLFFALVISISAFAQDSGGRSSSDLTVVLQKCIDLPQLQGHLPIGPDGAIKQLHIVKYPFEVPKDILLNKAGKTVVILDAGATEGLQNYFMFRRVDLTATSAIISFNFFANSDSGSKPLTVFVELKKHDGMWNVINSNLQ